MLHTQTVPLIFNIFILKLYTYLDYVNIIAFSETFKTRLNIIFLLPFNISWGLPLGMKTLHAMEHLKHKRLPLHWFTDYSYTS